MNRTEARLALRGVPEGVRGTSRGEVRLELMAKKETDICKIADVYIFLGNYAVFYLLMDLYFPFVRKRSALFFTPASVL